jgi:hypothetical protein
MATCPSNVYQSVTADGCQGSYSLEMESLSPSKSPRKPPEALTWGCSLLHSASILSQARASCLGPVPVTAQYDRRKAGGGPRPWRAQVLPSTDDIITEPASTLLPSRRPTLLNKPSSAWHQRKARLPFRREARPAALLVAHRVGIG